MRDWLESSDWDKTPPGPELPVEQSSMERAQRYLEAFERITGAVSPRYLRGGHHAMNYRFAVAVMPKPGILDPQGRAVERASATSTSAVCVTCASGGTSN